MVFANGLVNCNTQRCTEMLVMRDADILDFTDVNAYGGTFLAAELLIDGCVVATADCTEVPRLCFARNSKLELPYVAMYMSVISIKLHHEIDLSATHTEIPHMMIRATQLEHEQRADACANVNGKTIKFVDGLSGIVKTIFIKEGYAELLA